MTYQKDILDRFEQRKIHLKADYEGFVIATLIKKNVIHSNKAVLYIHGFNDYFFQADMATAFNENGINFYAIDLRRYGRSYLSHQKFNDIRNLKSYYEEIDKAIDIIKAEGNSAIFLMGHSTGGLITTLYAKDHPNETSIKGIILNSPFYDFNKPLLTKLILPLASTIGKLLPNIKISGGFTEEYGKSIHINYNGEWDYNLEWKPNIAPPINLGWIRAIYKAQQELKKSFRLSQPALILHSDSSVTNEKDLNQISTRDAILNVKDINRVAQNIQSTKQISIIKGGLHDLALSQQTVRKEFYKVIFSWIKNIES